MNNFGLPVNPRVNQLDASLLDSELLSELKDQLMNAFKFWKPQIKDKYEPELMLALKALLFKVTIWDNSTTYGAKLQNLVLVSSRTKRPIGPKTKALYGLIVVFAPYLWKKALDRDMVAVSVLDRLCLVWNIATLSNFVAFVFSGEYLTVVLRLLGTRYASATRKSVRNVNYEFQNRQLIWNALTEFLLFVLPVINFRRIVRLAVKPWQNPAQVGKEEGPFAFIPEKMCAICFEQDSTIAAKGVVNPYTAGCKHAYCYVCLSLRLAEDPKWNCLKCNEELTTEKLTKYTGSVQHIYNDL